MLIVKPETILRWHRRGFQLLWKRKSQPKGRETRIACETIELIKRMARENRLWGAERIRGELLKICIHHAKSTIQRYIRTVRRPNGRGPSWPTFLRNHFRHIWACDFVRTYDIFFRPIFAFLIIELDSRLLVHVGVTKHPTSEWTAQQLRNATAWSAGPRFLIRDGDGKYGHAFHRAVEPAGSRPIRTPYRAPNANAYCERLIGSIRRECLDHVIILGERHMESVLREYQRYYNGARPHQGLGQRVPRPSNQSKRGDLVVGLPVLDGLHYDYRLAA
jgi:transposase InsO family protein